MKKREKIEATLILSPLSVSTSVCSPSLKVLVVVPAGRVRVTEMTSPFLETSVTTFAFRPFSIISSGTPV